MDCFKNFFHRQQASPKEEAKEKSTLEECIAQIAKQEIRLSYTKAEGALPVGSGKIGGEPDLPADFVWPEFEGINYSDNCKEVRPLAFLAQINLKDIATYDREELLRRLRALLDRDALRVMIHEQYFYSDYHAYQPDFGEKLDQAFGLLRENGYESCFAEEL
jgi:hypothetical protein